MLTYYKLELFNQGQKQPARAYERVKLMSQPNESITAFMADTTYATIHDYSVGFNETNIRVTGYEAVEGGLLRPVVWVLTPLGGCCQ